MLDEAEELEEAEEAERRVLRGAPSRAAAASRSTMKRPTSESPIVTSYEIICDEARMLPSSDQLLLLAQPAITAP